MQSPSADDAKAWADEGLEDLREQFAGFDFPLDRETAWTFIRAAYGRGYCVALEEPEAPILTDIFERLAILDVLLPVE